jgi:hypothetical protein
MTWTTAPASGIAVAHRAVDALAERLGLPLPPEARPGADLAARTAAGLPWPARAPLLRTADGWVHPGPSTAWADFTALVAFLGAPVPGGGGPGAGLLPDVSMLGAEAIDAEAGVWHLPVVAVRPPPPPDLVRLDPVTALDPVDGRSVRDARVVLLGTAWATPLVGLLLSQLGALVTRVEDPRRPDPFPLREALAAGQERVPLDLSTPTGRDAFAELLRGARLLVDGYRPRVLANAGFGDDELIRAYPRLGRLRVAAFVADERPGYGPAAECRGGWATRQTPPRLGRSSVADPVAGCLAARYGAELLGSGGGGARVSLEGAVRHLLAVEACA